MPLEIKYVEGGTGVEFISSGVLTGTEIINANKQVYDSDNFNKQRYQLIDRTGCKKYQVSSEEMRTIAEQDRAAAETNPHILVALVAKSALQFGMSRMYEIFVSECGFLTAIFPDRESAMEWIEKELNKTDKTAAKQADPIRATGNGSIGKSD